MLWLINFLRGYLRVEITGAFPERFLNACAQNGVDFWGLKRMGKNCLRACVRRQGWRKLEEERVLTGNEITVIAKCGLPFKLWRVRHRTVLLAGAVLTVLALLVLSQFVWEIEIMGNDRVSEAVIRRNLSAVGVKIGVYAPSIDLAEVKNEMLLRVEDLSWLTVNVKGSRATVEVRERIPKPDIIPRDVPCNIVADKDGVIVRMDTTEGSARVMPGQTVFRGQLLVSGIADSATVGARFLHADADVRALTWYDLRAVAPRRVMAKAYTGRSQKVSVLIWGSRRVTMGISGFPSYAHYDKIVKTQKLTLPFGVILPVALVTEEYIEYEPVPAKIRGPDAEQRMGDTLTACLDDALGDAEIRSRSVTPESDETLIAVRLKAECLEQIARMVEIPRAASEPR